VIDPARSRSGSPAEDAGGDLRSRSAGEERLVAALAAGDERTFQELFRGKYPLMKTDPGSAPDPGHPGTGTVVARIC
jgi:hypothetical protein